MLNSIASLNLAKLNAITHKYLGALFVVLMTIMATPSAQTIPDPPTGLMVKQEAGVFIVTTNSITLTWTAPAGPVTGYRIQRALPIINTDPEFFDLVGNTGTTTTSYTDDGSIAGFSLVADTAYLYRVSALNNAIEGAFAEVLVGTLPVAPSAPTRLQVETITSNSITLIWDAALADSDNPAATIVIGYQIDRAVGTGPIMNLVQNNAFLPSDTGTTTSYIDMRLSPGTVYTYDVRAINNGVGGDATSIAARVVATTLPAGAPTAPTELSATAHATLPQIALSWKIPADHGGSPITGYKIERAEGERGLFKTIEPSPALNLTGSPITYTDMGLDLGSVGLAPNTLYRYRVRAISAFAPDGGVPAIASATTAIIAPSGLALTATLVSATEVHLSWTLADNGGEAVTYSLQRSSMTSFDPMTATIVLDNPTDIVLTPDNTAIEFSDIGLTAGITYYYQVTATNTAGSVQSAIKSAMNMPAAPGGLALTATTSGTTTIDLSWGVTSDGGDPLIGYSLERSSSITLGGDLIAPIIMLTSGTATSFMDNRGLAPGTLYYYRVKATNRGGTVSVTGSATTAVARPSGLALEATASGTTTINLSWGVDSDGGDPSIAYSLERSLNMDISDSTDITLPSGTATSFMDNRGLAPGTLYYYRVKATNRGGTVSVTGSATTAVAPPSGLALTAIPTGTTTIDLSWSVTSNGGDPSITYSLLRSEDSSFTGTEAVTFTPGMDSVTDSRLAPGTPYYYQLTATNRGGTVSVTGSATTLAAPPAAPINLRVKVRTDSSITLEWDVPASNGSPIIGYRIERGGGPLGNFGDDGLVEIIGSQTETEYNDMGDMDTGLAPNTLYRYQVTAINAAGHGVPATENFATLPSLPAALPAAPDAPGDLATENIMMDSVTLTWKIPATNGGTLASYTIERAEGAGAFTSVTPDPILVGDVALTLRGTSTIVYTDSGLTAGTTYSYQVRATNMGSVGSPPSNEVTATTLAAPDAPGDLRITGSTTNSLTLEWDAPDNGGSMITGYRIERRAEGEADFSELVANTGTATIGYTDGVSPPGIRLAPNMEYSYRISAINSVGTGAVSNVATDITLPVPPVALPAAPDAPGDLRITGSTTNSLTLEWDAPDNGGSMITGYRIERRAEGEADFSELVANTGTATIGYTDGVSPPGIRLAPNMEYSYRISAINSVGTGAVSNVATDITLPVPPVALPVPPGIPTLLSATAHATLVQITLSWNAPTDIGGSVITSYRIERAEGADGLFNAITPAPVLNLTGSPITYIDTGIDLDPMGLSPNTPYRYRVSAISDGGTGAMSNVAMATTAVALPSGLTLTAIQTSATAVRLSWELASDGGEAVSYTLERSSSVTSVAVLGDPMTSVTILGPPITDITPASGIDTSFTDSGLEPDTTYYYRVTAINSRGMISAIETPTGRISERTQGLNVSLLPIIAQTTIAMTLDAISNRIDNVLSGDVTNKTTFAGAEDGFTMLKQLGSDLSSEQELGDMLLRWLGNSSFSHSFAGSDDSASSGISVWGSGDYKNLEDEDAVLRWDGYLWSAQLGADVHINDWLLGTALSWSSGKFDYTDGAIMLTGDYDYRNFSIHPYFNWAPSGAGYDIWGSLSYGRGEIEIQDQAMPREVSSDTSQYGVAAGINLTLFASNNIKGNNATIDLRSDVSALWIDVDGSGEDILSDTFQHQRVRLLLSGEYDYVVGVQRHLIPSIELGGRYDTGGGAEDGAGIEFSGSLIYKNLLTGFHLSGRMNTLLSAEYDEWGASALLRFGDNGSSRGLSFSLEPTIGRTSSNPRGLWEEGLSGISDVSSRLGSSIVSEISYGMGMHSTFSIPATWQPYANMELGSAIRRYRLGLRYQFVQGLGFRVEGQSLRSSGAGATNSNTGKDYGVQLKTEFEF